MTGRPLGDRVLLPEATRPSPITLVGRTVTLAPLNANHANELFPIFNNDHPDQTALWDYIPDGPYDEVSQLRADFAGRSASVDPLFFAIIDTRPPNGDTNIASSSGKAVGYIALMSISPEHRRLEIGHVILSRLLQRTTGATEAVYLLLRYSIEDLGYRRVEWKCNALNEASRRAALRLGFQFEGVFRQHLVVKGRNRDTAWFSIVREEWEGLKEGLEGWLGEGNFDDEGKQLRRLEDIRQS
ncbi:acyl-CoA N-acyltransferase [Aspergillus aurantiobrunneus]